MMSLDKKIVVTGASGLIGSILIAHLSASYNLILTDIRESASPHDHSFVRCDITDLSALRDVFEEVDSVIHLAADSSTTAPWESLLPNNIIGAYNVFEAAHKAGCGRVIFASSVNAAFGYDSKTRVKASMPARPLNLYGASKVWG